MMDHAHVAVIIPALNEAQSLPHVLRALPAGVGPVIVVDNGSTDETATVAEAHGAVVVHEPRRGYGAACLRALAALAARWRDEGGQRVVVFLDADFSDDPTQLCELVDPILADQADLVIGSRVLGACEPGALTLPQRFGNWLASALLRRIWKVPCTDLGPFRAVEYDLLRRLAMDDLDYGWTVQMQARVARHAGRILEVPVRYRRRIGVSKISGTLRGVVGAGSKILTTIAREWWADRKARGQRCRLMVFTRLPHPGKAKTRLIPTLGPHGAAQLQSEMTLHTLAMARQWALDSTRQIQVCCAGGSPSQGAAIFGHEHRYVQQTPGDLGQRLLHAFEQSQIQGVPRVLCIGSDCPAITPSILEQASKALGHYDVVLGPATDGGYYLIGMTRPQPHLFRDIPWGTDQVLARTRDQVAQRGLRCLELETLADVDEPADLPGWDKLRETHIHTAHQPWLSVIIPAFHEEDHVAAAIASAQQASGVEVIVADGGSTDQTRQRASDAGAMVIASPPGRAAQMNRGAAAAHGPCLLFLHADTRLPFGFEHVVRRWLISPDIIAGAFRMGFDRAQLSLRIIEWATHLRSTRGQLPYGDQGLFLRRQTFDAFGGFGESGDMEDYDLIQWLRQRGRIMVSPLPALTSCRAYDHGPWRRVLSHQFMRLRWHLAHRRTGSSRACHHDSNAPPAGNEKKLTAPHTGG